MPESQFKASGLQGGKRAGSMIGHSMAGIGGLRGGLGLAGGLGMGHGAGGIFGAGMMTPASHVHGPALNGVQGGSLYMGGVGGHGTMGGMGAAIGIAPGLASLASSGVYGPQAASSNASTAPVGVQGSRTDWLTTNNLQGPLNMHWWGQAAVHPPHMFNEVPELASLGTHWDLMSKTSPFKSPEINLRPTHMGDALHDKFGRPYIKSMMIASKLPDFPPAPIPNPYGKLGANLEPYNLLTPAPFHAIPGDFPRLATFAQQGKVDPIMYQRDVANGATPTGAPTWPPKYFKDNGAVDPRIESDKVKVDSIQGQHM